jgi:hypothetical protein
VALVLRRSFGIANRPEPESDIHVLAVAPLGALKIDDRYRVLLVAVKRRTLATEPVGLAPFAKLGGDGVNRHAAR